MGGQREAGDVSKACLAFLRLREERPVCRGIWLGAPERGAQGIIVVGGQPHRAAGAVFGLLLELADNVDDVRGELGARLGPGEENLADQQPDDRVAELAVGLALGDPDPCWIVVRRRLLLLPGGSRVDIGIYCRAA